MAVSFISKILVSIYFTGSLHSASVNGFGVPPIASSSWVADNVNNSDLFVIDVRDESSYNVSHIPSSISIPFDFDSSWARTSVKESLSMPPPDELFLDLGANGITGDTKVILVSDMGSMPIHITQATRVATTLRYAGLGTGQVGILDGGIASWISEGKQVMSDERVVPTPATYAGLVDNSFIVDREYVHDRIGLADVGTILLDVRAVPAYDAGHIESAISLPLTTIWNEDGMFKSDQELLDVFQRAIGNSPFTQDVGEVIVYCTLGQYATAWFYVLTSVLGYENIKLYDGSTTDWVRKYDLVSSETES